MSALKEVWVTCPECKGQGKVTKLKDARTVQEVVRDCRKQGATNNEIVAAAWIEQLLEDTEKKS